MKRNTKLPYFPKLAVRENYDGSLPTFIGALLARAHKADVAEV